MKNSFRLILTFCLVVSCRITSWGQCAPVLPSCTNCIALTASNQTINSGTYCVTTSISNLNLNGSAVICVSGAGALNGGNVNGGTIIYNGSTATNPLAINLNGGTLRIRSSITLNTLTAINGSGTLVVENGATLTVPNLDLNGHLIVDGGTLYVNGSFGINGNGSVCFDHNGIVNTNQFTRNDQLNSATTNSVAKGCFAIRSSVGNFNQVLTNTTNVVVCLPGAVPSPNKLGSATVNPNCSNSSANGGCLAPLPVRLMAFQAQSLGEGVRLYWTTSLEQNFDYFVVERSSDVIGFEAISPHIMALSEQPGKRQYEWTDVNAKQGTFYYRLKQVDLGNTYTYSKIIGVVFASDDSDVTITPNPFSNDLAVTLNTLTMGTYQIDLYSAVGKRYASITGNKLEPAVTKTIDATALPAGFTLSISKWVINTLFAK